MPTALHTHQRCAQLVLFLISQDRSRYIQSSPCGVGAGVSATVRLAHIKRMSLSPPLAGEMRQSGGGEDLS